MVDRVNVTFIEETNTYYFRAVATDGWPVSFPIWWWQWDPIPKAVFQGSRGSDIISLMGTQTNVVHSYGGNDTISINGYGVAATNTIDVGAGNDVVDCSRSTGINKIWGGSGDDTITGGSGNDQIHDTEGKSTIRAGAGNDTITFGQNGTRDESIFDGGAGNDTITNNNMRDEWTINAPAADHVLIYGGGGEDSVKVGVMFSSVWGGSGDDDLKVQGLSNKVYGDSGDDLIRTRGNGHKVYGGSGDDTIIIDKATGGWFGNKTVVSGGDGNDSISYVGNDGGEVYGNRGADLIDFCGTSNAKIVFKSRDEDGNFIDTVDCFNGRGNNKIDLTDLNLSPFNVTISNNGHGDYTLTAGYWWLNNSVTIKFTHAYSLDMGDIML